MTRPRLVVLCLVQSTRFQPLLAHVVAARSQSTISASGLGSLLAIRVRNDSIPTCFCAIFAYIHPLGFQSNSNLFPTPVQPFVFDFWPWPGCKIPMQKSYWGKNMNSCFRAFPVLLLLLFTRVCLVARLLGFLLIFLYNAKPSFEISKWMAKHMLCENMKINKIIQKTSNLATYIKPIFEPKEGRPLRGRPLLVQVLERCRFLGF